MICHALLIGDWWIFYDKVGSRHQLGLALESPNNNRVGLGLNRHEKTDLLVDFDL